MREALSIYIHIPYCKQKCLYCDFLSYSRCEEQEIQSYVNLLCAEMQEKAEQYGRRKCQEQAEQYGRRKCWEQAEQYGRRKCQENGQEMCRENGVTDQMEYEVATVFIGGGTPSSIPAHLIEKILCQLKTLFLISADAEISMEMNPGTVTREKLKTYRSAGVNRLSFGLQSANDAELKALGRIHTYQEFEKNYQLARELGFDNINIDLMSAIPEQTTASFGQTLETVIALKPEHVSAYSLIVEEGTPFYNMELNLPDEDTEREMYHMAVKRLQAAGYGHYEISNFALPGRECRHNRVYWNRGNYLGLGLGAASMLQNVRYSNTRVMQDYLAGRFQDRETIEELDIPDQMAEMMFLGLREMQGVSEELFYRTFQRRMREVWPGVIEKFEREGLLYEKEGRVALTERGIDVSNTVMCEFMP